MTPKAAGVKCIEAKVNLTLWMAAVGVKREQIASGDDWCHGIMRDICININMPATACCMIRKHDIEK
jgi:hypothetical protein